MVKSVFEVPPPAMLWGGTAQRDPTNPWELGIYRVLLQRMAHSHISDQFTSYFLQHSGTLIFLFCLLRWQREDETTEKQNHGAWAGGWGRDFLCNSPLSTQSLGVSDRQGWEGILCSTWTVFSPLQSLFSTELPLPKLNQFVLYLKYSVLIPSPPSLFCCQSWGIRSI